MKFFISLLSLYSLAAGAAYDPQHAIWSKLLGSRVKQGVVDYVGFKSDSVELARYVDQIGEVTKSEYEAWPREAQMAYLINAYNAFTVKLVADFYPVESIRDIGEKVGGNLFNKKSKQWKVSEYLVGGKKVVFRAMGKPVTLDEIEHENLRAKFKDPRVHFTLVCGAVSCPFLRSEAYVASKLEAQLEAQGKDFLADPFRNRYDDKKEILFVSKIFDWFNGDFKAHGDLLTFLKKYLPAETLAKVKEKTPIEYLDYDWSLNSKQGRVVSTHGSD